MSSFVYSSAEQRRVGRVLPDLFRAREILRDLIVKDFKARYRYTAMGFVWAVLQPLALMLILTFIFTTVFPTRGPDVRHDFATSVLCGLIFWQYFAASTSLATHSLVGNVDLIKKVYFTREVLPIAAIAYPLTNLLIGFLVLLGVHLARGGTLGVEIFWCVPLFCIQWLLVLGLGMLLSCGNVYFRDVAYLVEVALLFGFYASPVFYELHQVLDSDLSGLLKTLYLANPMTGLLTGYRQILLEQRPPEGWLLLYPALLAAAVTALGLVAFRRSAPTLSDYV
jgi:lipopolysaccharide transport system permease protein